MVCHQCGKTVADEDRFCTGCGTRLRAVDPTPDIDDSAPDDDTDETEIIPLTSDDAARDEAAPGDDTDETARDEAAPGDDHDETAGDEAAPGDDHDETARDDAAPGDDTDDTDDTEIVPVTSDDRGDGDSTPDGSDDGGLPTELLSVGGDDDEWGASDPVWAATAPTPTTGDPTDETAPVSTSELPSTEPITEVWMESADDVWMESVPDAGEAPPTPYDFVEREPTTSTTTTSTPASTATTTTALPTATAEMPAMVPVHAPETRRFRFGAVTFLAIVTGFVALASMFSVVVSVASDTRLTIGDDAPFGFRTGDWIADDLADNLSIAGLLAVLIVVIGGVAAAFGWRWGSGLAGGGGLALAGLAALALGLAQIPIDAAHEFARIPPEEPFTLTITRDLGYWLLVVAGALGVVLFFASINDAFGDRRAGLNPWIAALGALATLVAAGGPLLPENLAVFSDNWYLVDGPGEAPALLLAGRLVQLALLALTGLLGFLSVRRWGLGVAIGGALPAVWLGVSTLFELTDAPVGPGFRNPGADDMHLHGVTIIGISAVAAIAVLAVIAAYDQSVRERP